MIIAKAVISRDPFKSIVVVIDVRSAEIPAETAPKIKPRSPPALNRDIA
jgi:hypothetical protein